MGEDKTLLVVDSSVLPDVFGKVVEAKRLLHAGIVHTIHDAVKQVGISRSVFYKYKEHVFPFSGSARGHIITIYALLKDEPGVLSQMMGELYRAGANILTINQNIPTNGRAPVSVSVRVDGVSEGRENLLEVIRRVYGVENIELIATD